jgi:hypothetical protein
MTHRTETQITEAKELAKKSGNSFHSRVVNLLRQEGWSVLVSPYYSDNFTEKPREIDIIAEKKFDVNEFALGWIGTIDVRLLIECKYLNGKTVFWFDAKDKEKAAGRVKKDTGMEHPNHDTQGLHHLEDTPVAKLFVSDKGGGGENDIWSKAINQNLNAFVYYRGKTDLIIPQDKHRVQRTILYVSYPLIVCNSFDTLYRTDMADEDEEIVPLAKPFQLEVNYAYTNVAHVGINEYFLIDVLSIKSLPAFLANLEKMDIAAIQKKVLWEKRMGNR